MRNPKLNARVVGLLYLVLSILAFFSILYVPSQIIVRTDAAATLNNILNHETLFRLGIVSDLLGSVTFLFLGLTLFRLFKPIHEHWARVLLVLVIVQIPVIFLGEAFNISGLMIATGYLAEGFEFSQRAEIVMLFLKTYHYGLMALEIFWGLWLIPFGLLGIKSKYFPRVLGVLLIIGGVAYIIESLSFFLLPDWSGNIEGVTMIVYSLAELSTILWLLIVGVRQGREVYS